MSVEYYYVNDLNKLFNAAVSDRTDGGEHHSEMMRSLDNLEAYIQNLEHWRDTALQLSKNTGEKCAELARLTTDRDGIAEENRMLSERIQRLADWHVRAERAEAELAALREKTRWIPVTRDLSDAEIEELGAQEAESRGD